MHIIQLTSLLWSNVRSMSNIAPPRADPTVGGSYNPCGNLIEKSLNTTLPPGKAAYVMLLEILHHGSQGHFVLWIIKASFDIKMPSYLYRKLHYGDKMFLQLSNLYNWIFCTSSPAGTWRNNNVIMTSKRHCVVCPLGEWYFYIETAPRKMYSTHIIYKYMKTMEMFNTPNPS